MTNKISNLYDFFKIFFDDHVKIDSIDDNQIFDIKKYDATKKTFVNRELSFQMIRNYK